MPSPGVTKNILADAMKTLMRAEPLSKISVSEIVEYCNLNRNSFYYHFKDKYDLVNWIFYTDFAETLRSEEVENSVWQSLEKIFQFFYADREFYVNALSISGQNSFSEYFSELMKSIFIVRAEELFEDGNDKEFYAQFVSDALLATITRWLCEGAKIPPDRLAEMIRRVFLNTSLRLEEIAIHP